MEEPIKYDTKIGVKIKGKHFERALREILSGCEDLEAIVVKVMHRFGDCIGITEDYDLEEWYRSFASEEAFVNWFNEEVVPEMHYKGVTGVMVLYYLQHVDAVNSPAHYISGGLECIDLLMAVLTPAQFEGFCLGNVIKYRFRAGAKGGAEDIEKSEWYWKKYDESRKFV